MFSFKNIIVFSPSKNIVHRYWAASKIMICPTPDLSKTIWFRGNKNNLIFYQILFDLGSLLAPKKHPKTSPGTSQNHPGVLSEVWDLPKPPQGPFCHHFINILYEFSLIFLWKSVEIDNLPKRESRKREPPPAGIGNLPQRESGILNPPPLESVPPPRGNR